MDKAYGESKNNSDIKDKHMAIEVPNDPYQRFVMTHLEALEPIYSSDFE